MKKIITIAALSLCYTAAKAQSKILISYDANGNRILRYCVQQRPATESDSSANQNNQSSEIISGDISKGGILSLENPGFRVYPNPSEDQFNISVDNTLLNARCEIVLTDQLGKIHYRKPALQAITTLSTKHLADGIYYIIVNYGDKRSSVKLVKESGR